MEFWAYGLLYAANTSPKQLAMELRGVPQRAWQHPYLQHALQVGLLIPPDLEARVLQYRINLTISMCVNALKRATFVAGVPGGKAGRCGAAAGPV